MALLSTGFLKVGFFSPTLFNTCTLPKEGGGKGYEIVILLVASPVPFCTLGNPVFQNTCQQNFLEGILIGSVGAACLVASWIWLGMYSLGTLTGVKVLFVCFSSNPHPCKPGSSCQYQNNPG